MNTTKGDGLEVQELIMVSTTQNNGINRTSSSNDKVPGDILKGLCTLFDCTEYLIGHLVAIGKVLRGGRCLQPKAMSPIWNLVELD